MYCFIVENTIPKCTNLKEIKNLKKKNKLLCKYNVFYFGCLWAYVEAVHTIFMMILWYELRTHDLPHERQTY